MQFNEISTSIKKTQYHYIKSIYVVWVQKKNDLEPKSSELIEWIGSTRKIPALAILTETQREENEIRKEIIITIIESFYFNDYIKREQCSNCTCMKII